MIKLIIPEVGENVESGLVTQVMVSIGDTISKDQPIIELETDKATIEIPAQESGRISQILVQKGDSVKIGQVYLHLESDSELVQETPAEPKPSTEPLRPEAETRATNKKDPAFEATALTAKELMDVPAAPSVRRFAREIGIRIVDVPGSGEGGRIFKEDVKRYSKQLNEKRDGLAGPRAPQSAQGLAKALPNFSSFGRIRRDPMNAIRKKTIENLSIAHQAIPPVTAFDSADITALDELRKSKSQGDLKLTLTPFLVAVLARALQEFPKFNASIDLDREEIIYKEYYNIGVAVDTERGLLVPVVKDVLNKSIETLAREIALLAEKARQKKIMPDDLAGGSMTLTNLGGIGGSRFTPIVF